MRLIKLGMLGMLIVGLLVILNRKEIISIYRFGLGLALYKNGYMEGAIREWQETIRIDPDHAWAHNRLGVAYAQKGLLDEAIAEYKDAIRIDPDDSNAHTNLGRAYDQKGMLEEAIAEYKEAIRIDPDVHIAHVYLSLATEAIAEYKEEILLDEAIAEYKDAIRIDPDDSNAHANLGVAYAQKGLLDEAKAEYKEAIRIDPDDAIAHTDLIIAISLSELGRATSVSDGPPGWVLILAGIAEVVKMYWIIPIVIAAVVIVYMGIQYGIDRYEVGHKAAVRTWKGRFISAKVVLYDVVVIVLLALFGVYIYSEVSDAPAGWVMSLGGIAESILEAVFDP